MCTPAVRELPQYRAILSWRSETGIRSVVYAFTRPD